MTTLAPPTLIATADKWENQLSSAVFSGIKGDTNHPDGMHISYEDNPRGNWSISRPPDKPPKMALTLKKLACAADMSMNAQDMITTYKRVHAVWADHSDPRRIYFLGWNVWDGLGDAVRLDFDTNTAQFATPDHKWHTHGEIHRMYVNDSKAHRAWLSMTGGQTKAQWISQEEVEMITYPRFGDTGEAVKNLQYDLADTGDYTGKVDGIYGLDTTAAVLKFRKRFLTAAIAGSGKSVTGWMVHKLARELNLIDIQKAAATPKTE
jgi:hypothetical protein